MKIGAAYQYQLRDMGKSIGVYYLVIILLVLFGICMVTFGNSGSVQMPFDSISAIFLFVAALCSFKENFFYFAQNSISRRCFFLTKLLTMVTVCIAMALIDGLLSVGLTAIFADERLSFPQFAAILNNGQMGFIGSELYAICSNLIAFAAGSFITVMFYRLNKLGKIIVGAGVPVFLFIFLPILLSYTAAYAPGVTNSMFNVLLDFLSWLTASMGRVCICFLILAVVIMGFTWLMERRAVIKAK